MFVMKLDIVCYGYLLHYAFLSFLVIFYLAFNNPPTYMLGMYLHIYIHMYLCTYVYANIHTYIYTYLCTYVPMYIPTYVPAYVHKDGYSYIYMYTNISTYMIMRIYYLPTYWQIYLCTYIVDTHMCT